MRAPRSALQVLAAWLLAVWVHAADRQPEERYIVSYHPGSAARASGATGLKVERRLPRLDAIALRMSTADAERLARNPDVLWVERDPPRFPVAALRTAPSAADIPPAPGSNSTQIIPWGVNAVQAAGLPGVTTAGIRICVIDSGYDLGHEDKPVRPTVAGEDDPLGTGAWTRDEAGHGTHVSGTINARNNTVGVLGVFPRAPMYIVKVFNAANTWAYSSDLIAALDRCIAAGAKVVNMSLGGDAPSYAEQLAFRKARDAGVIAVAAAGNDGTALLSYPASYPSVISVAAVDPNLLRAGFSNFNSRVQLSAPGVSVLSTVPRGTNAKAELTSGLGTQSVAPMDNFPIPKSPVSGRIANCGLAGTPAACAGANGAICLIERGTYFFWEKAQSCQAAGGIGAVVYNRAGEAGVVNGTLGDTHVDIPIVGTDRITGLSLLQSYLGTTATLTFSDRAYAYYDGTSMAAPHVAGVAALVWSRHPNCDSETVRLSLMATARDLGVPGRDPDYGAGLVRARAANAWLARQPCAGP